VVFEPLKFILFSSAVQKSEIIVRGPKQGVWHSYPSGGSRGIPIPDLFLILVAMSF
jgi:hypothetical protein